jgi:xylulokinase
LDSPVPITQGEFLEIDALLDAIILAGVGVGIYKDVEDGCKKAVKLKEEKIKPIPENVDIYHKQFKIYKSLYQDLKEDFKKLKEKR